MARDARSGGGWFADPAGRFRFRYHDGHRWTDQVLDGHRREEQTDVLEPALQAVPPRPALPTLAEPTVGDRMLAPAGVTVAADPTAPPLDVFVDDDRSRARWRIPRPSTFLITLVVLAGLVAGGAVLVGNAADDAAKPNSSFNRFIDRGIAGPGATPTTTPFVSVAPPGSGIDGGVDFTTDAAPAGTRRTDLDGVSIPIPTSWRAMTPTSLAFQSELARTGATAQPGLALYVEGPGVPDMLMTVVRLPVGPSVLDQSSELEAEAKTAPGLVPGSAKVDRIRLAGSGGLRLRLAMTTPRADGTRVTLSVQSYVLRVADDKVDEISFAAASDVTGNPTIATIVENLRRVH